MVLWQFRKIIFVFKKHSLLDPVTTIYFSPWIKYGETSKIELTCKCKEENECQLVEESQYVTDIEETGSEKLMVL